MTFEQLKPYWDALDLLFPADRIAAFTQDELAAYEKLCKAILNQEGAMQ